MKLTNVKALEINTAQALTEWVLYGKKDKQGLPVIDHVRRVADRCHGLSLQQYLAAIMHDCLEDCQWPHDSVRLQVVIERLFGLQVSQLVLSLTHEKNDETYQEYIERLAKNKLAIPIKLADLADNMDPSRGDFPGRDRLLARYEKAKVYLERKLAEVSS